MVLHAQRRLRTASGAGGDSGDGGSDGVGAADAMAVAEMTEAGKMRNVSSGAAATMAASWANSWSCMGGGTKGDGDDGGLACRQRQTRSGAIATAAAATAAAATAAAATVACC